MAAAHGPDSGLECGALSFWRPPVLRRLRRSKLTQRWRAFVVALGLYAALGAYAVLFVNRLPGRGLVRGATYGVVPWLLAQLVVMPMMGAGFFSGSFVSAAGSLMGHLVYGAVLGAIYGVPADDPCPACDAPARV